jgi:hypothetical protein
VGVGAGDGGVGDGLGLGDGVDDGDGLSEAGDGDGEALEPLPVAVEPPELVEPPEVDPPLVVGDEVPPLGEPFVPFEPVAFDELPVVPVVLSAIMGVPSGLVVTADGFTTKRPPMMTIAILTMVTMSDAAMSFFNGWSVTYL